MPYDMDGRNLWIYSTGRITICESRMIYLRQCLFNENSTLDFFGGIKLNENEWFPVSILGVHKHMYEPVKVARYTVYGRRAAYFITDTEEVSFMVKAAITSDKKITFSVVSANKTEKEQEVYISAYFQPHFEYGNDIHIGSPMPRYGKLYENGNYKFTSRMDVDYFAVLNKFFDSNNTPVVESTCSKKSFIGNTRNTLTSADSLKTGHIKDVKKGMNTVDVACAADIAHIKLDPSSDATAHYLITFTTDEKEVQAQLDGIKIAMTNFMPTDSAKISLKIKGKDLTVVYKKDCTGERKFFVNGVEKASVINEVSNTPEIFIKTNELTQSNIVEIVE